MISVDIASGKLSPYNILQFVFLTILNLIVWTRTNCPGDYCLKDPKGSLHPDLAPSYRVLTALTVGNGKLPTCSERPQEAPHLLKKHTTWARSLHKSCVNARLGILMMFAEALIGRFAGLQNRLETQIQHHQLVCACYILVLLCTIGSSV